MSKEIINDAPPIGTVFYTEGKANEMVAEERAKWLSVIKDIKSATNDIEWFGDDAFWDGVSAVLEIIDRKVNEIRHNEKQSELNHGRDGKGV